MRANGKALMMHFRRLNYIVVGCNLKIEETRACMMPYLYRLRGDLEFGQWGLAIRLHLSHGAAVWLSAVAFCLRALGFCRFLAIHRPYICRGLLKHRARFGHKRRRKGLTRVLSAGEGGVNPWRWVPVGLPFPWGFGAVALLAVVLLSS